MRRMLTILTQPLQPVSLESLRHQGGHGEATIGSLFILTLFTWAVAIWATMGKEKEDQPQTEKEEPADHQSTNWRKVAEGRGHHNSRGRCESLTKTAGGLPPRMVTI